jgi:hypothetical protein
MIRTCMTATLPKFKGLKPDIDSFNTFLGSPI